VLALIGILIRYSAILIVQIEQLKEEGRPVWDADGGSHKTSDAADHADRGCRKSRPHPNRSRDFLGSYGVRHNGGIILGMVRTLLFLPALYVASSGPRSRRPQYITLTKIRLPPKCKLSLQLKRALSINWKMHRS
jgi:hypothetical protein